MKRTNKFKSKNKKQEGITLIALVVTIIVLLILVGVSIAMLTGENGILTQAQRAKEETENAKVNEANTLTNYEQIINSNTGITLETITGYETNNTVTQDSLGNRVVVPAGFKVVNPTDNVEDGIIIKDVTHEATEESEFVWIPVGTIRTSKGTKTITLSRYTFDNEGIATKQDNKEIIDTEWGDIYQELNIGKGNTTAKENIESENTGFRKSAIVNGGYYIARYEARTETARSTIEESLSQTTVKPNDYVYNWVTQPQAAKLSQEMYNDNNFTSDLINSYAWDTTIDFLQKCDDRTKNNSIPYSQQTNFNAEGVTEKGTNGTENEDIICNIYDMAGNCIEWTTELCFSFSRPCTYRGGVCNNKDACPAFRSNNTISNSSEYNTFRPIIYL